MVSEGQEFEMEKMNIVLFAVGPDQEYAITNKGEYYANSWDNSGTYDQHSYENVYNQSYSNGSYQNFYSNGAQRNAQIINENLSEVPIEGNGGIDEVAFSAVLKIRRDGFLHNFVNGGIFFADENAVALLKELGGVSVGHVRKERPDIAEALML